VQRRSLRVPLIATVAAAAMLAAGCSSSHSSTSGSGGGGGGTIKFGVLAPFTGSTANFGKEFAAGAQVAAAEINASGGVLGKQVTILNGDTVGDPIDAVAALNKLVNVDKISGIIGPQTPEIGAVKPIIDRHQIPDMFQGGSTDFDKNTDPYIWRAGPSDSQLGVAMALYAKSKGYTKAALVFSNEPSAQTLKPVVASTFQKIGGTIVSTVDVTLDQSSYRSEVARVIASNPQVIFTSEDNTTAAALFNDFKQANNLSIPFVGTDSTTGSDYVNAIGGPKVANKALVSLVGGSEPGGGGTVFNTWYAKVLGGQPIANSSYGYDAVIDLALAIQKAGTTSGPAVVAQLPNVSNPPGTAVSDWTTALAALKAGTKINYEGASGPMDFDKYHNVFGPFDAIQVDPSGTPKTITTFNAAQLQAVTPSS
jgi:ABC-type branched-subunit amino acid transport system substrate-binding protein